MFDYHRAYETRFQRPRGFCLHLLTVPRRRKKLDHLPLNLKVLTDFFER